MCEWNPIRQNDLCECVLFIMNIMILVFIKCDGDIKVSYGVAVARRQIEISTSNQDTHLNWPKNNHNQIRALTRCYPRVHRCQLKNGWSSHEHGLEIWSPGVQWEIATRYFSRNLCKKFLCVSCTLLHWVHLKSYFFVCLFVGFLVNFWSFSLPNPFAIAYSI